MSQLCKWSVKTRPNDDFELPSCISLYGCLLGHVLEALHIIGSIKSLSGLAKKRVVKNGKVLIADDLPPTTTVLAMTLIADDLPPTTTVLAMTLIADDLPPTTTIMYLVLCLSP